MTLIPEAPTDPVEFDACASDSRPAAVSERSEHAGRKSITFDAAVVALFCLLAVGVFWELWARGLGSVYQYENDGIQMMWFLNWVPYALGHALNPFHSSLVNVPHGVNILNQTSSLLIGLVLSPVTLLFGPTVSYNVGETLALAGSATSMYFVVRRFTDWRPAAFVAGLLYGFGPYEIGQGLAHLNLSFVVLPPIILFLVSAIASRHDGKAKRRGIVLGLLVVAQFFISTEVLVTTAVISIVLVVVIAIRGRRSLRQRVVEAARGYAWAGGVAGTLLSYPAWYALAGPGHVSGPLQITALGRADLLGLVVPDGLMRIAPSSFVAMANQFAENWNENGSYLGITLVVVLALGVVWLRRRPEVQVAAAIGIIGFVLSLGQKLVVRSAPGVLANGTATGSIPLPWDGLSRLPILRNVLPARFSLYSAMAAALLAALILDRLHARMRRARSPSAATLGPLSVAAIALFPLIPAVPFGFARPIPRTTYFESAFVRELPAGGVAVVYPYPSAAIPGAALWQTQSDMRFAMPGGYYLVPGPTGAIATSPVAINAYPSAVATTLSELYLGKPPEPTPTLQARLRHDLTAWHVRTVLAFPVPGTATTVVGYISWIVGARPVHQADAYAWYRIGDARARRR